MFNIRKWKLFYTVLAMVFSSQAFALTLSDDFTQATDNTGNWTPITFGGYPCMTAGTSSNNTTSNSNLPGCNWGTPDAVGSGALRLTPAADSQHSAIMSQGVFPTNAGLQATFTTYTYGGDSGGPANDGADGMSFFLMDGSVPITFGGVNNLGSWGGSLGYSCSNTNTPYTGLTGAYLGLGMDEYGNFLNGGSGKDNTATGIPIQTTSLSTNPNLSFGSYTNGTTQQANRIGLRGAGNVSWYWLNQNYPTFYPSSLTASQKASAVQNTCQSGTLWSYANAVVNSITAVAVSGTTLTLTVSNHGYTAGDQVTIGGTITATAPPAQAITTLTNSGSTMTVKVPSVSGYSNGQSITIGGSITTTQGISSISNYTGTPKTVRINVSNTSGYAVGQSITISGVTGTNASYVNGTFLIQSVSSGYFTILAASGNPGTVTTTSAKVTAFIPGSYTINNVNAGASTFQVTLGFTPFPSSAAISYTSGTVTVPPPTIPGTYTIANVTTNTFDITLGTAPVSVTNTSGTATDTTQNGTATNPVQLSTTVMDYPVIPGGFWVLPDANKIANENTSTRANATPITYKLRITPGGLLSYMYSYNNGAWQQVLTNWPITTSNGPLPANFRFGFAASTGGSNNAHEISCFVAEPFQSNSSAGGNTIQAGQVRTGTQVYLASYDPNTWTGSLVSNSILNNSGTLSVSTVANWDTNCVLTGGACQNMTNAGVTPSVAVESPSARNLLTWSGSAGIPLQWTNLTSAQQTILNSTDSNGQLRLNWLRGDRSQEQTAVPAGNLRARAGVLGDIINSSPTWVGPPSQNYLSPFQDALYPAASNPENGGSAQRYSTFSSNNVTRTNVVFTGSNDGLLHGSRAGSNNADGSYNSTNNDGYEVIGFMPSTVLANSNVIGLTSPTYGHNYFVDAAPGFGDLFYNNSWHTWLVGGLGAGGAEVYALDITNPSNFSESNASSLVKGDWTPSTLTNCVNFTNTSAPTVTCGTANMGNSYGTPIIRRLHNGQWAIIFGNGLGSTNNSAGVFVGLVNATTGAVSYYWLDTFKNGTASTPNGIAYVTSADLDGDHVTDYLYAGDLLGNVWRFDLTSSNPADWRVTDFSNPSAAPGTIASHPSPLFTAVNSGNIQPISTRLVVSATYDGGAQRVILGFGTGQSTPFTTTSSVTYAPGVQTAYGIWDWNLNNWNIGATTANSVVIPAGASQYAALTSSPSTQPITRFMLSNTSIPTTATPPGLFYQTATTRSLGLNQVCWQGSMACPSAINSSTNNTQYGWLFDFPTSVANTPTAGTTTYEQLVYNPVFSAGEMLMNTTIPAVTTPGQCAPSLPTGWTMAFNIASGGGVANKAGQVTNVLGSSTIISSTGYSTIGMQLNGVGTPWIVSAGTQQNIVTQTTTGKPTIKKFTPQGGVTIKRTSWEQLR